MDLKEFLRSLFGCCCALIILLGLISVIIVLASIKTLGPEDQVLIYYLDGHEVINGPKVQILNPFRDRDWRKAVRIGNLEYIRIKDKLNGGVKQISGNAKYFLGPYEEIDGVKLKLVIKKDEYIRLVDGLSGEERVVEGPRSLMPNEFESSDAGVQKVTYVTLDTAAIVMNRGTGQKKLHVDKGPYFPEAYEIVEEMTKLIRVLPHETMVVRNSLGRLTVHHNDTGTSFFLQPYDSIVSFTWSTFSEPMEGAVQSIGREVVERIDMRSRKTFFQYDVLTNETVALRIEGAIFWKITNVEEMLQMTSDPVGDVWYKERNRIMSVVSTTSLKEFMADFNNLIQTEFTKAVGDSFYIDRGVDVERIEVTKYDSIDPDTTATLQEIIKETTNRMNRLTAQQSENQVKQAKIEADIGLEAQRKNVLYKQAENELLAASRDGQALGVKLATATSSFMQGLGDSMDFDVKLNLYKLHRNLENQNIRTQHIAGGKSTLFLTPEDLSLNLKSTDA